MKYWVYIHTCPNGKKYVGTTIQDKPEYGYNNSLGGEKGSLGSTLSEQTRLKMSKSRKGKKRGPFPEEWRKHMSEAQKGMSKVQPKYSYLFPDGQVRILGPSHAKRFYLNKGINIIKLN